MIKTEYLGWELDEIFNDGDGTWKAVYYNSKTYSWTQGVGHTPEAALADAQKKIQQKERKGGR
jgi:hypothetical protein